jgi:hypothetical protein
MAVVDQTGQNIAAAASIHEGGLPTGASALSPATDAIADVVEAAERFFPASSDCLGALLLGPRGSLSMPMLATEALRTASKASIDY